ncbi:MAG: nucleotide sugar dehydrogenase [Deltaproteobacteria bacterium]|nr:nucleotide sugar dehydrogenase [Deltaproteobacteria bacterium]MBW2306194.1 nucleotide sugar dehydrogenase [Deltaproteobacteria bacterium]
MSIEKRIAVVGMGYVGIPCAALLADVDGFDVTGIQRQSRRSGWKIEALNAGQSPIEGNEPGLEELIAKVVAKGSFRVTDDFSVIRDMDIILIDVQTPTEGKNHRPRYESLKEVCQQVGRYLRRGALVITESTVAPGTTQHVIQPILERESGMKGSLDFYLAYSYERVMPGRLIRYIQELPRIVGGICPESERRAVEMYREIVKEAIYSADVLTVEVAKTMENAYRDVNIAFANEMALISENLGVDVFKIRELINSRAERHMHLPGPGVGGHCLPKDTWLLRYGLQRYGKWPMETSFIRLARHINDFMPFHMAGLIINGLRELGVRLLDARVAILGVAYLEDSDDTRNSPAFSIIEELASEEIRAVAHDPHVRNSDFSCIPLTRNLDDVLRDADCMAIVTKHKEYFNLDLAHVHQLMRTPFIVDGRNVIPGDLAGSLGFFFRGIGKDKMRASEPGVATARTMYGGASPQDPS